MPAIRSRFPRLVFPLLLLCLAPSPSLFGQNADTPAAADSSAQTPAAAPAVSTPTGPAAQTVDEIHNDLRAIKAAMEKGLNERNVEGLLEHVTDDVLFTTMNGDVARGKNGIRDYFKKMMEGPGKIVDKVTTRFVPDDLSLLFGDDTAIAFGASDDRYELTTGQAFDIQARWTATMVRQDGRWLIAAFHYSANVFDNPILNGQRKLLTQVGLGGVAVVFVLAFFFGRAIGRRSKG